MGVTHKTALVTGAAVRLGRAMALALAEDGFDVALHYRSSEEPARSLAADIETLGRRAVILKADLGVEDETGALVASACDAVGPLGVLVNNASLFEDDDALGAKRADWDKHMEANLRAPFVLAQDFARRHHEGDDALIVNMLDQRVWKPTPQFMTYSLSKAGLWWLTRTMAQALGPLGVRVNGVGPGPTLRNSRQSNDEFDAQGEATILGRASSPAEIVKALRYLVGASSVTGQMIAVDAGQHLAWATPDVLVNE